MPSTRTWYLSNRPAPGKFSDAERARIEAMLQAYCDARIPAQLRDELEVIFRIRGTTVTLLERRPHWERAGEWTELPVAQIRYHPATERWQLFWRDRHSRWHPYDRPPAKHLKTLLVEVERDPSGIFWG